MINKILCVDDDQVTLILCKILLDKTSFCNDMDEAGDGAAAMNYFEQLTMRHNAVAPDLIILDINMPVMNGWEFLNEFQAKYADVFPECQVIILLSNVNNFDSEKAKNYSNVIGFLQKPLSVDNLELLKQNDRLARYFDYATTK